MLKVVETPTPRLHVYLISSTSIHAIRGSLQIILDFAEKASNMEVIKQVHRIESEIQCQV